MTELEKALRIAADPNQSTTWSNAEWNEMRRATDEQWEVAMRDDFTWGYIIRDPLGNVCAWGTAPGTSVFVKGSRAPTTTAPKNWRRYETPEQEALAITGPWRLVLWPPRFDGDPRSFIGGVFDEQAR